MAYGIKYRCQFKDKLDNNITADILQDGYSGAITSIKGATNPLSLNWPGDRDNIFYPVRGAQATLTMISETDGQFNEFFNASNKEYKLNISNHFTGWLMLSDYYESMNSAPYEVTVSAYDIGYLQELTWDKSRVADDSVMDVIVHILDQTGLGLSIYDEVNVFENSIDSDAGDSMLTQINIHQAVFMDDSWDSITYYEALRRILLSCNSFIVQDTGRWRICRIPDLPIEHRYRSFNSSGVLGTYGTIDRTVLISSLYERNRSALMMVAPNYKNLRLSHKRGLLNLIHNGTVNDIDADITDYWSLDAGGGSFEYKDSVGYGSLTDVIIDPQKKQNNISILSGSSTGVRTFIEHDKSYEVFQDMKFNISYSYAAYKRALTAYTCSNVVIEIKITGASTYYLDMSDGSWDLSSTVSTISFSVTGVEEKEWTSVSFVTDSVPFDGTMTIRLRDANWDDGADNRTFFSLSIIPEVINDVAVDENGDYDELVDSNSLEDQPETEFVFGDAYHTDAMDVLLGSLTLASDGDPTNLWTPNNSGGQTDTLLNLAQKYYKDQYETPARRIQATLRGNLSYLSILKDSTDRCYLAGTLRKDFRENEITGEWLEIKQTCDGVGQAFNGTDEYAYVADNGALDIAEATTDFCLSANIYLSGTVTTGYYFVGKNVLGAADGRYGIGNSSSLEKVVFLFETTDSTYTIDTGLAMTVNDWKHIAVRVDLSGAKVYVYVDGSLVNAGGTSYAGTFTNLANAYEFYLAAGNNSDGSGVERITDCEIKDVRIYHKDITSNLTDLMNGKKLGNEVAWWCLSDLTGYDDTDYDLTGVNI